MRLSNIGERKVVAGIRERFDIWHLIGDDCAAIDMGDSYLLFTTDIVTARSHMLKMVPYNLGWYCAAVNLSDIASKGGEPIGLGISLLLPRDEDESTVQGIMEGFCDVCRKYNTPLMGGDTKEADIIAASGVALGRVGKEGFLPRSGAMVGDVIALTGKLGHAYAGFIDERYSEHLWHIHPKLEEGRVLSSVQGVHACTDISDGLSTSLHNIADESSCGFEVFFDSIPAASELLELTENWEEPLLHFGGDFELLFSCTDEALEELKRRITVYPIGRITEQGRIIWINEKRYTLENKGWEHFIS